MSSTYSLIASSDREKILVITVLDDKLTDENQLCIWQDEMREKIRRSRPSGVVIDMKNVICMTNGAVFPLVAARAVADEVGAEFTLCNLSSGVTNVLTTTQRIVESHNARQLTMANSLDDAIAAVSLAHLCNE